MSYSRSKSVSFPDLVSSLSEMSTLTAVSWRNFVWNFSFSSLGKANTDSSFSRSFSRALSKLNSSCLSFSFFLSNESVSTTIWGSLVLDQMASGFVVGASFLNGNPSSCFSLISPFGRDRSHTEASRNTSTARSMFTHNLHSRVFFRSNSEFCNRDKNNLLSDSKWTWILNTLRKIIDLSGCPLSPASSTSNKWNHP